MDSLGPEDLPALARDVYVSRLTLVATLTFLVYDYLLTFGEEKRLVWPSRLSIPKIAFFLNRYLPFVGAVGLVHVQLLVDPVKHLDMCRPEFLVFGSIVLAGYPIAGFILYMRAYAVSGCKLSMLRLLILTYVAVCTIGLYFAVRFLRTVYVINRPLFPTGCLLGLQGKINRLGMTVTVVSEMFALAILLVKGSQLPHSSIMKVIVADGIVYFILIISASIVNIIVLSAASPALCNFFLVTQNALHSICCNRLLLRIRGVYDSLTEVVSVFDNHPVGDFDIRSCENIEMISS